MPYTGACSEVNYSIIRRIKYYPQCVSITDVRTVKMKIGSAFKLLKPPMLYLCIVRGIYIINPYNSVSRLKQKFCYPPPDESSTTGDEIFHNYFLSFLFAVMAKSVSIAFLSSLKISDLKSDFSWNTIVPSCETR